MWIYVIVAVPLTVLGLWRMRKDYRERGHLGAGGFTALLFMFFVPHLALHDAFNYAIEWTPWALTGLAMAVLGLALCLWGIITFHSLAKVFAFDHGTLSTRGPYRWSRNPQYVGWTLFFVGFAIMGCVRDCVIPLGLYVVILHYMVLGEEEHLSRTFGEDYEAFKRRVPRYVGFVRRGTDNGL